MVHDEIAAIEDIKSRPENTRMHLSHVIRHALCLAHLVSYRHKDMELCELVWNMKKEVEKAGL